MAWTVTVIRSLVPKPDVMPNQPVRTVNSFSQIEAMAFAMPWAWPFESSYFTTKFVVVCTVWTAIPDASISVLLGAGGGRRFGALQLSPIAADDPRAGKR